MQTAIADERWMRLALSLGRRGLGMTWPNPAVGCVIIKNNHVIGRGWTQTGGRPHAEIIALAQAGSDAKGATAYVTLEPCAHTGKTPPCANALINAGIKRVVAAISDPDPRVGGKGFDILRQSGIVTTTDVLGPLAADAHAGFFKKTTQNLPLVTLKLATSLDAKIATQSGESKWITSAVARDYVHFLRATHDAIMIGSGTSIADDPKLDVRLAGLSDRSPVRVICDSALSTPINSNLAVQMDSAPVWICHTERAAQDVKQAWESQGAKLMLCDNDGPQVSLMDALTKLAAQGITRVLCEGGATLATSLIKKGLVDQLITFNAGMVIGAGGLDCIGALSSDNLADTPRFKLIEQRSIGGDALCVWQSV